MNIIEFFFGIFKECFDVINVDFFGLGFTWLEFILGGAIIFVIISFVKGVVGVGDYVNFDNIVQDASYQRSISNRDRERQIFSGNFEVKPMSDEEVEAFKERLKTIR